MLRIILGILALGQIIGGIVLLSGMDISAQISFDSQKDSYWTNVDTATATYGPSPDPSSVSVGTITLNRESH